MLNYLWAFMILAGILWGAFHGTMSQVTQGALESAKEAVSLCITMLGVMSLWTGILEIGQRAGLIGQIAGKMKPVLRFLFPNLPEGHPAGDAIATNVIANVLGLGWAATPAGLKAMEELAKLEEERRREGAGKGAAGFGLPAVPKGMASNEMCTFLIINISSLQLIPVNMIAYRSQYGSVNPAAVVGPAIVATAVSTIAAVVFCKIMDRKRRI
ncbi:MAG: nucleoside recognition protein [Hungatella sp.]|nr:nucleoside recognition protein [Hungatella sp.]